MLVCAAVIPHGDFIADPSLLPAGERPRADAEELRRSAQDVARSFRSVNVETIIFVTPHGISTDIDTSVYLGKKASGCAHIGRDAGTSGWRMRLADVDIDGEVATELRDALQRSGNKVSGLTSFGGYEDVPLRYGEIIPLSFIIGRMDGEDDDEWVKVDRNMVGHEDEEKREGFEVLNKPRCVIISLPNRRYKEGPSMVAEMLQLGSNLRHFIDSSVSLKDRRVAILVSADLAHTHQASGPYGYSPAAQPFDNACAKWARSLNGPPLLEEAKYLLDQAKSCGYLGLVVLHGTLVFSIVPEDGSSDVKATDTWSCQLHSISHPTYYGMMVASFSHQNELH